MPLQVVQLTPPGRGAVATLLVEGPGAVKVVGGSFKANSGRRLTAGACDRPIFGLFELGLEGSEEVVVRCRSVESVELHCHGGRAAVARIEQVLMGQGCKTVRWKDWAKEHCEDPIRADALVALADARTERTAAILLDQYQGALRRAVERIQQAIDTGDDAAAGGQLNELLARAELGRHLVEPWRVVLAGRPNAGKSSLINALVGYARAIVHHAPGTTRDVLTATTAVDGWPLELSDTAGLRQGEHPVERAGVRLAEQTLAAADRIVLVFDSARPWSDADRVLMEDWPAGLPVHNKCDLPPAAGARPPGLHTSALRGDGIDELVRVLADSLVPRPPPPGVAVPWTTDQVAGLRAAAAAVGQGDLQSAASALAGL